MNIAQIENNLQQLVKTFKPENFMYDLLLAYGQPKATIKRLKDGGLNLSRVAGEIAWKKKLFFKAVEGIDLHAQMANLSADSKSLKHDPRFVVVTDYATLLAIDTKTQDTLDIAILDIAQHFDFFLPWAGMEKAQHQNENPADVRAAEKMAKLYDDIKKDNPTTTPAEVHNLNVFLSRLLFCFFAEDTGIFLDKGQFTLAISSHTQQDGSDLHAYLDKLFEVMNTEQHKRESLPNFLNAFPYVNGGLFRNKHTAPKFTRKSRQSVIDSGELDWSAINPDIFGSMIQAVITPEHRGGLGMHYTSVPNIMKVIEPLFLNELYEEFEAAKGNNKKLNALLHRIWNIKIFDPACGSGNFLIIAYKELRKLEMKIFKELDALQGKLGTGKLDLGQESFSQISLGNFYGIELDDFAHEIAILSLWLAEHQMNQLFFKKFGRTKPALPLTETGNIVQGNATRLDWETVCPKDKSDEVYILGNPPYLGAKELDKLQQEDANIVLSELGNVKRLDYIGCWFKKATDFIDKSIHKFAFVSTDSICQGEQVELIWPYIFSHNLEIIFAYKSFKWSNNAKDKAGVTVIIVGLAKIGSNKKKFIFNSTMKYEALNISPYLTSGSSIYMTQRTQPISNFPKMILGSSGFDGGFLILNEEEKNSIIQQNPLAATLIRKFLSGDDFLNDKTRYCLWIDDNQVELANQIIPIKNRIDKCKEFRVSAGRDAKKAASVPHRFFYRTHVETNKILFPKTTSGRREYVPLGFIDSRSIISNASFVINNVDESIFAILSSKMHNLWLSITSARMNTSFRYSVNLTYNTFPFPDITENQKKELEKHVYNVLSEREYHSEKTLAQLYDPDKMPAGLREAHHQLDLAVERCYRAKPFESDEERLEYLFKLYEQMIAEEKSKGTLFEAEAKPKKKKQ